MFEVERSLGSARAAGDEAKSGFSLGLSVDGGVTFKTLFRKPALTLLASPYNRRKPGSIARRLRLDKKLRWASTREAPESAGSGSAPTQGGDAGTTEPLDAGAVASAGESGTVAGGASSSAGATASAAQPGSTSSSGCALTSSRAAESSRNALLRCLGLQLTVRALQQRRRRP